MICATSRRINSHRGFHQRYSVRDNGGIRTSAEDHAPFARRTTPARLLSPRQTHNMPARSPAAVLSLICRNQPVQVTPSCAVTPDDMENPNSSGEVIETLTVTFTKLLTDFLRVNENPRPSTH